MPKRPGRLPRSGYFPTIGAMEVHLTPDVEKQLHDLSAQSGRATDDLLQDALAGYLAELTRTREMLDRRYDELKSGERRAISSNEVEAHFRDKSASARRSR